MTSDSTDDVKAHHERAVSMYNIKMRKIPDRAFFLSRKPTLIEIYKETDLHNPLVHEDCQLPMVLSNYNMFVSSRFRAQKTEQDPAITLALWL